MTSGSVPANQRPVNQGGLMRCCLATLEQSTEPSAIGTILHCWYENRNYSGQMIVGEDGTWRWNQ